ncbi:putative ribonuclease H-like domain-containing protein [Tanacetum coccineum]
MGDENPICTLGDYSKPSHEGYMNTIELPVGNNVVPLRSDTIRLVQNGCSFHGLRSEDPNQHLKDFLKLDHPLKNMEDRGIFDSGCSGHMTGNKDHLDDFEECKGGSVTFGGSKGYITGKGIIRVGNLDFDSVSFVKELGHFNLFSILQICDKQHKVLFTKIECLVVSPDFKMPDENQILLKEVRFSWVFFLATKDETSGILQNFIRQIENQLNHMVKIIRSDNGTEFKNRDMLEFCGNKGIKQEYSNARTPQQNGVAERMNRTLIEAARTMLADSLLPTTFWAEAVSTACYIFNRVREVPKNKQPVLYLSSGIVQLILNMMPDQDDSDMQSSTILTTSEKGF